MQAPVKVIFLFGGLPHYYNAILNRLHSVSGLDVEVVVPSGKGKVLKAGVYESQHNVSFQVHPLEEIRGMGGLGKPYFKGLARLIRQEKPQVLVLSYPYALGYIFDFPLRLACSQLNVKLILKEIPYQVPLYSQAVSYYLSGQYVTEDLEPPPKDTPFNRLKYWVLAQVRRYYFNLMDAHVNYVEEAFDILGSYGVSREKIFITYNSPDTETIFKIREGLEKTIPQLHPYRIVHLGRLVKWKKVHLLIGLLPELLLRFPQTELLVIGDGPGKEALIRQAQEVGVSDHVRFAGPIHETAALGKELMESAIYVLAGVGGLSINDAMCFGKPIICSVADGTEKALVINGYNGYIFENDNVTQLRVRLEELLADPEKVSYMGKNSEKIIREKINVHTVIRGYVAAFNFVCTTQLEYKQDITLST
jgi:glycosyltransferase involved in cell wall biosynthesis